METLIDHPLCRIDKTEDGILDARVHGIADDDDVREFFEQFQAVIEAEAPVRFLIDASGLVDSSLAARWRLAGIMKGNRRFIDRTAVYGISPNLKVVLRIILRTSGRTNVGVFDTRAEALDSLRKPDRD
ncbi:MAG: STAS/SEC14 domain-containing protein [Proteobacteria bacterium]|nr:STAS/SEC14 domain-containing protein [Pseudomonadota bacterium]